MRHFGFLAAFVLCALFFSSGAGFAQGDTLSVDDAGDVPGATNVPMTLRATNTVAIQGFSVAATFATQGLDVVGVDYSGTIVETIVGGSPGYSQLIVDEALGTVVLGVIFDLMPSSFVEIPPTPNPYQLVRFLFDVATTAIPNDYPVDLVNGIGDPAVSNAFSSGGQSIFPTLSGGTFTIENLFAFRVRSANVAPGSDVDVIIECTNGEVIAGYTICVAFDNTILTHTPLFIGNPLCPPSPLQDNEPQIDCLDVQMALAPETIEVIIYEELSNVAPNTNWFTFGCVFDFCPPNEGQQLPIGADQEILKLRFSVSPTAPIGSSTTIDLTNDFPVAMPVTNLVVTEPAVGIIPILIDGQLNFVGGMQFIRGDANGDGSVNLADAIFALNFFFVSGSPPILCFDAADQNDDGGTDITDVIFFLTFFFQGGCPPPAPYPGCGIDEDDSDSLDCTIYINC